MNSTNNLMELTVGGIILMVVFGGSILVEWAINKWWSCQCSKGNHRLFMTTNNSHYKFRSCKCGHAWKMLNKGGDW
jgi:hypothetical protein